MADTDYRPIIGAPLVNSTQLSICLTVLTSAPHIWQISGSGQVADSTLSGISLVFWAESSVQWALYGLLWPVMPYRKMAEWFEVLLEMETLGFLMPCTFSQFDADFAFCYWHCTDFSWVLEWHRLFCGCCISGPDSTRMADKWTVYIAGHAFVYAQWVLPATAGEWTDTLYMHQPHIYGDVSWELYKWSSLLLAFRHVIVPFRLASVCNKTELKEFTIVRAFLIKDMFRHCLESESVNILGMLVHSEENRICGQWSVLIGSSLGQIQLHGN